MSPCPASLATSTESGIRSYTLWQSLRGRLTCLVFGSQDLEEKLVWRKNAPLLYDLFALCQLQLACVCSFISVPFHKMDAHRFAKTPATHADTIWYQEITTASAGIECFKVEKCWQHWQIWQTFRRKMYLHSPTNRRWLGANSTICVLAPRRGGRTDQIGSWPPAKRMSEEYLGISMHLTFILPFRCRDSCGGWLWE